MAGTKLGGQRAAAKNLANDPLFYTKIGSKGGSKTHADGARPKGFAAMTPEKRSAAGRLGGQRSGRRGSDV